MDIYLMEYYIVIENEYIEDYLMIQRDVYDILVRKKCRLLKQFNGFFILLVFDKYYMYINIQKKGQKERQEKIIGNIFGR